MNFWRKTVNSPVGEFTGTPVYRQWELICELEKELIQRFSPYLKDMPPDKISLDESEMKKIPKEFHDKITMSAIFEFVRRTNLSEGGFCEE
ncbi:uncharacterized protein VNE69_09149 [Vairimorpha necatrix]|uniref:Transposase n=1 Tax=Vairimorpha necatrix TaxID=6039 RepID=A0AAX4JFM7_9MICR